MNRRCEANGHVSQFCNGSANGHCPTNEATPTAQQNGIAKNREVKPLPSLRELVADPANACTLVGGIMGVLALVNVWKGEFLLANFFNMAANLVDIVDGPIARMMKEKRHPLFPYLGITLDAFSDLVSHFVVPASMLVKLSNVNVIYTTVAITWVLAGIIRLSYVTYIEYGLLSKTATNGPGGLDGVTSDYMNVICAMCFHMYNIVSDDALSAILCCVTVCMSYGCLCSHMRTLRYAGMGLAMVMLFNAGVMLSCLVLWFVTSQLPHVDGGMLSTTFLLIHAVFFYPSYLKYVELKKH